MNSLAATAFAIFAIFVHSSTDRWTALGVAGVFALLHIGDQIGRRRLEADKQETK